MLQDLFGWLGNKEAVYQKRMINGFQQLVGASEPH
jgi:hypothetical protein